FPTRRSSDLASQSAVTPRTRRPPEHTEQASMALRAVFGLTIARSAPKSFCFVRSRGLRVLRVTVLLISSWTTPSGLSGQRHQGPGGREMCDSCGVEIEHDEIRMSFRQPVSM